MLADMGKINQDYEACLEKNASIILDCNMSQQPDPMAMSIFSTSGQPNSQLQRHAESPGGRPE